jgi:hypothetical protein
MFRRNSKKVKKVEDPEEPASDATITLSGLDTGFDIMGGKE